MSPLRAAAAAVARTGQASHETPVATSARRNAPIVKRAHLILLTTLLGPSAAIASEPMTYCVIGTTSGDQTGPLERRWICFPALKAQATPIRGEVDAIDTVQLEDPDGSR